MSYLEDPIFNAVRQLRDPAKLAPVLARVLPAWSLAPRMEVNVRLLYLNYKPFERARLVLCASPGANDEGLPSDTTELVLEVLESARSAELLLEGRANSSSFAIPEWSTRGWMLSDAPGLENVSSLRDPDALRAQMGRALGFNSGPVEVDLLRYVPRNRAVLAIAQQERPGRTYAKLWRAKDASVLAAHYQAVDRIAQKDRVAFRVPRVLVFEPKLDTAFMSEVPGIPFTEVIRRAEAAPFAAVGDALASLHGVKFQPATTWTTTNQLHDLGRHLAGMGRVLPWLHRRLETLVARLTALDPLPPEGGGCAIHGNLFGDQILWDGAQAGIVDWDRLALGDPLYDVGRLLAHHVYESAVSDVAPENARVCADALIVAYDYGAKRQIERQRLTWHVAVELLLRAKISALRPLPDDWRENCACAIEECERVIEGKCKYAALPALGRKSE